MVSDASGTWGCGAICGSRWLQLPWKGLALTAQHISIKEMIPIIIATAIWGKDWKGKSIHILSDNAAVVAAINSNTSKVRETAHLLRCLAFIAAHWQCHLTSAHILGNQNCLADAISRNNIAVLRTLYPQADEEPDYIPPELLQLLIVETPDWNSVRWMKLWKAIFHKDWPPLQEKSMQLESVGMPTSASNSN